LSGYIANPIRLVRLPSRRAHQGVPEPQQGPHIIRQPPCARHTAMPSRCGHGHGVVDEREFLRPSSQSAGGTTRQKAERAQLVVSQCAIACLRTGPCPASPSSSGSRAILIAIRRASSAVSILACIDAPLYTLRRLPADPQPVSQANQVLREDAALASRRAMRLRTRLTCWADHAPRLESVGIFLAVSAAARARGDLNPPARSLVRIGAKLAARASARSDWALEPGLPLVRPWVISHQNTWRAALFTHSCAAATHWRLARHSRRCRRARVRGSGVMRLPWRQSTSLPSCCRWSRQG
jgi:hypothetical protein